MKHSERIERIRKAIELDDDTLLDDTSLKLKDQLLQVLAKMLEGTESQASLVRWMRDQFGFSTAVAHSRVRDCKDLFVDLLPTNRSVDVLLLGMRAEKLWDDAERIDDAKDRVTVRTNILREMARLKGLDRGEGAEVDPRHVEPHEYHIKVPKLLVRQLMGMLSGGVVDLPTPDIPEAQVISTTPSTQQHGQAGT